MICCRDTVGRVFSEVIHANALPVLSPAFFLFIMPVSDPSE